MKKVVEETLHLLTGMQVLIVTSTTKDTKVPAFKRIRVRVYIDSVEVMDNRYMTQGAFDDIVHQVLCDLMKLYKNEAF